MLGGLSAHDNWNSEGFWSKIDAIAILILRVNVMIIIVSLVIAIVSCAAIILGFKH